MTTRMHAHIYLNSINTGIDLIKSTPHPHSNSQYLEGGWKLYPFSKMTVVGSPLGSMSTPAIVLSHISSTMHEFFPAGQTLHLLKQLLVTNAPLVMCSTPVPMDGSGCGSHCRSQAHNSVRLLVCLSWQPEPAIHWGGKERGNCP